MYWPTELKHPGVKPQAWLGPGAPPIPLVLSRPSSPLHGFILRQPLLRLWPHSTSSDSSRRQDSKDPMTSLSRPESFVTLMSLPGQDSCWPSRVSRRPSIPSGERVPKENQDAVDNEESLENVLQAGPPHPVEITSALDPLLLRERVLPE